MEIVRPETAPPIAGAYEAAGDVAGAAVGMAGSAVAAVPSTAMSLTAMGYLAALPGIGKRGFKWRGLPMGTGLRTAVGVKKNIFRQMTTGTLGGTALLSAMGVNPIAAFGISGAMNIGPRILGKVLGNPTKMTGIGGIVEALGLEVPSAFKSLISGAQTTLGKAGPLPYQAVGTNKLAKAVYARDKFFKQAMKQEGQTAVSMAHNSRYQRLSGKVLKETKRAETILGMKEFTTDVDKLRKITRPSRYMSYMVDDPTLPGRRIAIGTGRTVPGLKLSRRAAQERLLTTSIFERVQGAQGAEIYGYRMTGKDISRITGLTTAGGRETGKLGMLFRTGWGKKDVGIDYMRRVFGKAATAESEVHIMRAFREATAQSGIFSARQKATRLFVEEVVGQYGTALAGTNNRAAKAAIDKLSKGMGVTKLSIEGAIADAGSKAGKDEITKKVSEQITSKLKGSMRRQSWARVGLTAGKFAGIAAVAGATAGGIWSAATTGARKLDDALRNLNAGLRNVEMGGRGAFSNEVVSTERQRAIATMQFLRTGRDFIGKEARLIAEAR